MPSEGYAKRLVRERTGRDVRELLVDWYVSRRYTQGEIATALGISRITVYDWLREYGISREDRAAVFGRCPVCGLVEAAGYDCTRDGTGLTGTTDRAPAHWSLKAARTGVGAIR